MADRTSINVSLPDEMRQWVEKTVAKSGYGTVSEYVRELVRKDQRRRAREEIEARILEALNGPATPLTKDDWAEVRRKLIEKHTSRQPRCAG